MIVFLMLSLNFFPSFFFQAEDGIRDDLVTGVQTCALPIYIWTRPGLDRRSRSLVSMSVMIAMRQPHEFAIHMGAGLNNGLTLKEIEEVLIQALPYVGYPAIATALAAAAEVIKERGLDVDENYAGHRGLL